MTHIAQNPNFAADVERSVLALPAARLLGFRFARIAAGETDLELLYRDELSSHGVFQGGIIGALADFAGGAAAGTLLAPGATNVTADFTVKLLAPAKGEKLLARGCVLNAGKVTTVSKADLYVANGGSETLCATALVTMRNIPAKSGDTL